MLTHAKRAYDRNAVKVCKSPVDKMKTVVDTRAWEASAGSKDNLRP